MADNRPRGRKRNVTEGGSGVNLRGDGLGTGPVGSGTSGRGSSGSGSEQRNGRGMGGLPLIVLIIIALLGGGGSLGGLFGGGGSSGSYSSTGNNWNVDDNYTSSSGDSNFNFYNSSYSGNGSLSTGWTRGLTAQDNLWNVQCQVIAELADKESCVIVGRCADYILRARADCLTVFIHADRDTRDERIAGEYGVPEDSVVRRRKEKDKRRAAYYQFYTDMKWGDARNYHICLDSGELGIDKCVDILAQLY